MYNTRVPFSSVRAYIRIVTKILYRTPRHCAYLKIKFHADESYELAYRNIITVCAFVIKKMSYFLRFRTDHKKKKKKSLL